MVAYVKLFVDGGFQLREGDVGFKDQVHEVGNRAESKVLAYSKANRIRAKGAGSVLREMRKLHRTGALDQLIIAYRQRLAIGEVVDPAPAITQDILQVLGIKVIQGSVTQGTCS